MKKPMSAAQKNRAANARGLDRTALMKAKDLSGSVVSPSYSKLAREKVAIQKSIKPKATSKATTGAKANYLKGKK
jgi:hypothetical protein